MASVIAPAACKTPLSAAHVRMLDDGRFFLAHRASLRQDARIEPRCRQCGTIPTVTPLVGQEAVEVRCDCRAGRVKTDRPLEVQPLLMALGWDLVCADCQAPVTGDNAPSASVFTVTCPCQRRVYRRTVQ